jgi:hypothetical protein
MIPPLASPDSTIFGRKTLGRFFPMPSWSSWRTINKAAFALSLDENELAFFKEVSGRTVAPKKRVKELFIITSRRSGKTAYTSGIAGHFGAFHDFRPWLRPGENAVILCIACDREQAKVLAGYIRSYFSEVRALKRLVTRETADGLELSTGAELVVGTNSFRSVRGRSYALVIMDELAFYRSESTANPDTELYNAVLPGLANLPGSMLIGISSPWRKSGLLYDQYSKHWGRDDSDTLIIQGSSAIFNPTLDRDLIARAYAADPAAANAEWGGLWRADLEGFVDSTVVRDAVAPHRYELPPISGTRYVAFADAAAGGKDQFSIAICHLEKETIVLDVCRERRASQPSAIVEEYCALLKSYGCRTVIGDKYAKAWVQESFRKSGIEYRESPKTKSEIYVEFLPLLLNSRVELLDNKKLVAQICSLERTIMRGTGREVVDAPRGASEDLANACAGACVLGSAKRGMVITDEMLRRAAEPTGWRNMRAWPSLGPPGPLGGQVVR